MIKRYLTPAPVRVNFVREMEAPFFHLLDLLNRPDGTLMVGSILAGLLLLLAFFYWVYRKQVHPVIAWLLLSSGFFAMSQIFPENRNQRLQIALFEFPLTALLVWRAFAIIRKYKRPSPAAVPPPEDVTTAG